MSTLDDWLARVQAEFGLPPVDTELLLEVTRDVAHGVARVAAPLTSYLMGIAVGRGEDVASVAARIRALIPPEPAEQ